MAKADNKFINGRATKSRLGFTLIELSIVLVIIGLIIGGVLVGQDLIKAASIRATIQQLEKYNTAVHTFQSKYNGLPGDLAGQSASNFGFPSYLLLNGTHGFGDGNGVIEDGNNPMYDNDNAYVGEISVFWGQLSYANLIEGSYSSDLLANGFGSLTANVGAGSATPLNANIPPAKIGRGMSFIVFSGSGYNFFGLYPITAIYTGGVYVSAYLGIDPMTASNIDTKLDDGLPNTGAVLATRFVQPCVFPPSAGSPYGINPPIAANSAGSMICTIGTGISTDTYNTNASKGGNDPSCGMAFRFN